MQDLSFEDRDLKETVNLHLSCTVSYYSLSGAFILAVGDQSSEPCIEQTKTKSTKQFDSTSLGSGTSSLVSGGALIAITVLFLKCFTSRISLYVTYACLVKVKDCTVSFVKGGIEVKISLLSCSSIEIPYYNIHFHVLNSTGK